MQRTLEVDLYLLNVRQQSRQLNAGHQIALVNIAREVLKPNHAGCLNIRCQ